VSGFGGADDGLLADESPSKSSSRGSVSRGSTSSSSLFGIAKGSSGSTGALTLAPLRWERRFGSTWCYCIHRSLVIIIIYLLY